MVHRPAHCDEQHAWHRLHAFLGDRGGLAKGAALEAAVATAKDFVTAAIAHADELAIGRGRGPAPSFPEVLAEG